MFSSGFSRTVRWKPVGDAGLEHLFIDAGAGGVTIRSVVIGARGGRSYGIRYSIDCAPDWSVRSFSVEDVDGKHLAMRRDGERWTTGDGSEDVRFKGCDIIDLSGTPFTNTLTIRLLPGHAPGATRDYRVVYVPFDTLIPLVDEQRYTCVKPYALYHYEAVDRSFAVDLPVDEDALVVDYPGLFERIR